MFRKHNQEADHLANPEWQRKLTVETGDKYGRLELFGMAAQRQVEEQDVVL